MNIINKLYEKIYELVLNTFIAKPDEYYSYDEPSAKKMENKSFWIQIVRNEKEEK